MFIIAGLGNPSKEYINTRHNIGFRAIDCIADTFDISVARKNFNALIGQGRIESVPVLLMKPQTFMNLSGESVAAAVRYFNVKEQSELLIVYDDTDLDVGIIRIRKSGSAGGHNGMKSIIAHLGTQEFMRLRIGIGQKPPQWDLADYVLGHFTKAENEVLNKKTADITDAVRTIVKGDADRAMNLFNHI